MNQLRRAGRRRVVVSTVMTAVALTCAVSHAHAQKETERFIPIGQSPGLSLKLSWIGEVVAVDPRQQTITITDSAGRRTVKITNDTRIWLDRTKVKRMNLTGSFADLQVGRRVEVKYLDAARRDVAEWVKVESAQT